MLNYEKAITEVYALLEDLSKKITRNRNEADELLQEVIIQILEKDNRITALGEIRSNIQSA